MWYEQPSLVLVNEDTIYQRSKVDYAIHFWRQSAFPPQAYNFFQASKRLWEDEPPIARGTDTSALFFNRTAIVSTVTQGLTQWRPGPSWTFFQDPFVSVYPVIEAYQQASLTLIQPTVDIVQQFKGSLRLPEPEEDYRRFDHSVWFAMQRRYVAQLVGYTFTQPDFNDHPWLEWVHPPASPESALFPFRIALQVIRGQQYNLYFDLPRKWRIDAEEDPVFRKPDVGVLLPYARPIPPTFPMPNVLGLPLLSATAIVVGVGLIVTNVSTEDAIYPQSPPSPGPYFGPVPPIQPGIVVAQWPLPGAPVLFGGSVLLVISTGRVRYLDRGNEDNFNTPNTVIGQIVVP